MSDIMYAIANLLHAAWQFLMHTYIPSTTIPFGVMFVGLALIPIGFKFLSLAVGHNIGDPRDSAGSGFGDPKSHSLTVSDERKNDVR